MTAAVEAALAHAIEVTEAFQASGEPAAEWLVRITEAANAHAALADALASAESIKTIAALFPSLENELFDVADALSALAEGGCSEGDFTQAYGAAWQSLARAAEALGDFDGATLAEVGEDARGVVKALSSLAVGMRSAGRVFA